MLMMRKAIAEDARVDLRILVLLRDPVASLHTHMKRAKMDACGCTQSWRTTILRHVALYVHMYNAIAAQLSRLDPQFFRCLSLDDSPASSLSSWLGFDVAQAKRKVWKGRNKEVRKASIWVKDAYWERELTRAYDVVKSICAKV